MLWLYCRHACELGFVGEGDIVAIWGAGPVGMLAAHCAKVCPTLKPYSSCEQGRCGSLGWLACWLRIAQMQMSVDSHLQYLLLTGAFNVFICFAIIDIPSSGHAITCMKGIGQGSRRLPYETHCLR